MLQRTLPAGFIAPCLPTKTDKLPSGSQWLHEIKHDGFRIIARKDGPRVRLYSRPGNDLTHRFPRSSRRWHACARALASSTAKLSPAMTTELPRSICPGAGGIASLRGPAQVSGSCTTLCATWYTARPASHRSRRRSLCEPDVSARTGGGAPIHQNRLGNEPA
jgi:ATP dependent DNA ligase domain